MLFKRTDEPQNVIVTCPHCKYKVKLVKHDTIVDLWGGLCDGCGEFWNLEPSNGANGSGDVWADHDWSKQ